MFSMSRGLNAAKLLWKLEVITAAVVSDGDLCEVIENTSLDQLIFENLLRLELCS